MSFKNITKFDMKFVIRMLSGEKIDEEELDCYVDWGDGYIRGRNFRYSQSLTDVSNDLTYTGS